MRPSAKHKISPSDILVELSFTSFCSEMIIWKTVYRNALIFD
jgi:hypothetical protein